MTSANDSKILDDVSKVPVTRQEFKKANDVISPRVARGGTLTLLSRKVFNVLLYHTQRLGRPGADAPEGDPLYEDFFWIPMHELAADAAYNSEDAAVLKDALQRLQDIKIVSDDTKKGFASDVLIPSIRIVPTRRGKATMVGWKLDAATERILMSPEFYTRLSIYYLTSLKTTASIALYEVAKRYATNPSGLTARETWGWWHDVLTGLPVTHEKTEYKYFKRDVIKQAIDEVNTTDIRIELIEHKTVRKITHLQFRISKSPQASLELPVPPVIDSKIIEAIKNLGFGQREAEDLFASHDEGLLRGTLTWLEGRTADPSLPEVKDTAALFRAALRGRYADTKARQLEMRKAKRATPVLPPPEIVEEVDPRRTAAVKAYEAMLEPERIQCVETFAKTLSGPLAALFRKNSLGSALVRKAFERWLVEGTNI